jgi:hypothetical protein
MRRLILIAAIVSGLLLAGGAGAHPDAFKPRNCGEITVQKNAHNYTYRLKVFQAPLACSTAQTTMSRFLLSSVVPKHWVCRYGHSGDAWAATCGKLAKNAPIVRAYVVGKAGG